MFDDEEDDRDDDECDDRPFDVIAVLHDLVVELTLWYYGMQIPTQCCQDAVPNACSESGVEQEP